MADIFKPESRSRIMAGSRSKDTRPELAVRRIIHRMGYRFRLHRDDLPGKPDIVLPRLKKIVEVRGCFWHCHTCKNGKGKPATNAAYWAKKRTRNVRRDRRNVRALGLLGWEVLVLWECETGDTERLAARVAEFLAGDQS